jgi:1,3-alpha-isomaltosidase
LERRRPPRSAPAGHLAAAASSAPDTDGRTIWIARATATGDDTYTIVGRTTTGDEVTTAAFSLRPVVWRRDSGQLEVTDPGVVSVLDPESVEWLTGSDGPVRVRFALRLTDAEHVVGFGERFHALDQRGEVLDATVFEQYKSQGHRTSSCPRPGRRWCRHRGCSGRG